MTPRRFGIAVATFSAVHFILALGSLFIALSLSTERFDTGFITDKGPLEATASALTNVLWQPMAAIWSTIFTGRSGPWLLQWCALALNSLVWGSAVAWLFLTVRARLQAR